jgi:hypothetical protein
MTQLVIQLDDKLAGDLEEISEIERIPQNILVSDVLRRWLAVRWLKRSQERLGPIARAAGYNSEDDILNDIS